MYVCRPSSQYTQTPHYSITCFATQYDIISYHLTKWHLIFILLFLPYSLFAMIMATIRSGAAAVAGQVQGENEMRKLGQQKNMNSIQEKNHPEILQ